VSFIKSRIIIIYRNYLQLTKRMKYIEGKKRQSTYYYVYRFRNFCFLLLYY